MEENDELTFDKSAYKMYHAVSSTPNVPNNLKSNKNVLKIDCLTLIPNTDKSVKDLSRVKWCVIYIVSPGDNGALRTQ